MTTDNRNAETESGLAWEPTDSLVEWSSNPRRNAAAVAEVARSIKRFGFGAPIVANVRDRVLIAGHTRLLAARRLGLETVPVRWLDLDPADARALALADNRLGDIAEWDDAALALVLAELRAADETLLAETGFSQEELAALLGEAPPSEGPTPHPPSTLAERFLVPPFSVLNAREGVWLQRKAAWLALGIRSEVGRGGDETALTMASLSGRVPSYYHQKTQAEARLGRDLSPAEFQAEHLVIPEGGGLSSSGTSVFDPVLCELAYRWFSPPGGSVLDPFAGGSVRGIVAAALGRRYLGVDLRPEQVEANRKQAAIVLEKLASRDEETSGDVVIPEEWASLTPVVDVGNGIRVKREDLFRAPGGGNGTKLRAVLVAARRSGKAGIVSGGGRASTGAAALGAAARLLGIPARFHAPTGAETPELVQDGVEVVRHGPGYMTVIRARSREDAAARDWCLVPPGIECAEMVACSRAQVANVPEDVLRVVVPVGGGMALAGILQGLADRDLRVPVVGVRVGSKDTAKRLDAWAPSDWRERVELVDSPLKYEQDAPETRLGDLDLDPRYEAKCLPYLKPGDLLWVVARREENDR